MASHAKNTDTAGQLPTERRDEGPPDDTPMTEEQAILLKQLCEQADEPQAFDGELTKIEATHLIKEMRRKAGALH